LVVFAVSFFFFLGGGGVGCTLSKPNFIKFHQVMKFHEISWNILWTFMKFHISRTFMKFHDISWNFSWNLSWNFDGMFFHEKSFMTFTECFFMKKVSWKIVSISLTMKFHEMFHEISRLRGTIFARAGLSCKFLFF
jgi:hypothetical protein